MTRSKAEITRLVCEALEEIQEMSGAKPVKVSESTRPHCDLAGFDSHRGVETTVYLEIKLGIEIKLRRGEVNLFSGPDGHRKPLTVAEAVTIIQSISN